MGITIYWYNLVLTSALLLSNVIQYAVAESTIAVDMSTLIIVGKSRQVSATLSIDGDDLFNMPIFTFTGMGEGETSDTDSCANSNMSQPLCSDDPYCIHCWNDRFLVPSDGALCGLRLVERNSTRRNRVDKP